MSVDVSLRSEKRISVHCAIENLTTMKLVRIPNTCQIDLLQLVLRENGKNVCLPNGCKSDILCFSKP